MPFFDLPQSQLDTYRSSAFAPADFDSFWATTLGESRSKPLDAVFEPFDFTIEGLEHLEAARARALEWRAHHRSAGATA